MCHAKPRQHKVAMLAGWAWPEIGPHTPRSPPPPTCCKKHKPHVQVHERYNRTCAIVIPVTSHSPRACSRCAERRRRAVWRPPRTASGDHLLTVDSRRRRGAPKPQEHTESEHHTGRWTTASDAKEARRSLASLPGRDQSPKENRPSTQQQHRGGMRRWQELRSIRGPVVSLPCPSSWHKETRCWVLVLDLDCKYMQRVKDSQHSMCIVLSYTSANRTSMPKNGIFPVIHGLLGLPLNALRWSVMTGVLLRESI